MGETGETPMPKDDSFDPKVDVLAENEFDDADGLTEISMKEAMDRWLLGATDQAGKAQDWTQRALSLRERQKVQEVL